MDIEANSVQEYHLAANVRNKLNKSQSNNSGLAEFTSASDPNLTITLPCSEPIPLHSACSVTADGKACLASHIADDGKPVQFIAMSSGDQGQMIKFIVSGIISDMPETFEAGKSVFLSSGDLNISTAVPPHTQGNYIQRLGRMIGPSVFYVEIQNPRRVL